MSEQSIRLVERLRTRVRRTLRRLTLAKAATVAVWCVGGLALAWLLATAVEAGLWLPTTARSVLMGLLGAAALGALAYVARPTLQLLGVLPQPDDAAVAAHIGNAYPEVSDRLLTVLQLADGRRTEAPDPMVEAAVQRLGADVDAVPFEDLADFTPVQRASRYAVLPLLGVLAFFLIAPTTFLGASGRLLSPRTHFQPPAPFQLAVSPGDATRVKGDSLQIRIEATGDMPAALSLQVDPGAAPVQTMRLTPNAAGVFTHLLRGVRSDLRYRIRHPLLDTRWYRVTVHPRPLVQRLRVVITPPAYTGLPAETLATNVGDVTALPGSRVTVRAHVGGAPVERATLLFADSTQRPLTIDGRAALGSFTLYADGAYSLRLESPQGIANAAPIRYQLATQRDAPPAITFEAPTARAALTEALAPTLRLRLRDDFGFSRVRLYYRVSERRFGTPDSAFRSISLPPPPAGRDQTLSYTWLMAQASGLNLMPGDVVSYYAKVWDNNAVAGYRSDVTATQQLRLPSMAEQYEALDKTQQAATQTIDRMQQDAQQLRQETQELKQTIRRTREASWQSKRQAEQIAQQQQALEQKANQLQQQMEEITRQMQKGELTSPETQKLYKELQRVIEELKSPELERALQKLQEAMQQMDLRQMMQSMEQMTFNEEQYQQRLKRVKELFERLKAQQSLDELAKRSAAIAKLQKQLAEQTQKLAQGDSAAAARPQPSETANQQQPSGKKASERKKNAGQKPTAPQQKAAGRSPSPQKKTTQQQRDALAREQDRARKQLEALQKQLRKLTEPSASKALPKKQLQQLQQRMAQQKLSRQMKQSSQQLRRGQFKQAQQSQQQLQQQMQQMTQQLRQMKQQMSGKQRRINRAGLLAALDHTLRLSQQQEALRHAVDRLVSESPTLREKAQAQNRLVTGTTLLSDSLQHLAERIPQISSAFQARATNALRAMETATTALTEGRVPNATSEQKSAMMHLNELAALILDVLEQLNKGQGKGGGGMSMQQMMQQLQQMAGQQQQLNRQMQQFLNSVQGKRLSANQQARLKQLARQQERIQQELNALRKQAGPNAQQALGDLGKVAEQMEQTIRELQQQRVDRRRLNDRQQQILTRLLQAQQSLRTQGTDDQRKARTAEGTYERTPPDALSPAEQTDRLRRDLIRALESGYAPDYEALIRAYFERLQQLQAPAAPPR
ncbi:DUF4175 family protein [Salisaeta longa]|uniref:DUF4175 family protein n=1 Tax=Salisaeta longa TaxID=503170 RepID=UPI0003B6C4AD|nr:DUF4175 family protein [Salisaeta longa]